MSVAPERVRVVIADDSVLIREGTTRLLEDAGLVVTRKSGREKLHYLNPVPIRLIHDRWIDKYTERHVSALVDLKTELEGTA